MDENSRIDSLCRFLQEDPNDSFSAHALALEYVKLGKFAAARKLWEELLEHDTNYVGSYYHLGKLLEQLGERDKAIQYYARGIAVAQVLNARHAQSELQQALDELDE